MAKGNRGHPPAPSPYQRSAAAIAGWFEEHEGLLRGLLMLRDHGVDEEAVDALLGVAAVKRVRLSIELFESLAEGDGQDAEALLREHLDHDDIALLRAALWGQIGPGLRPIEGGRK